MRAVAHEPPASDDTTRCTPAAEVNDDSSGRSQWRLMSSLQREFQGATNGQDDATAMIRWLEHADAQPDIQKIKSEMLRAAPINPGDRVLDVGCGIGLETTRLLKHVGPAGAVVGVDLNAPMIDVARDRLGDAAGQIEYAVMDARQLDFPDDSFDVSRTERVLRYIEQPELALREMVRVTRPGGRVIVFDFDSDTFIVDAPDPDLTRRVATVLDGSIPNGWIGRQLPRHFRQAGLADITITPQIYIFPQLAGYRRLTEGTLDQAVRDEDLTASDVEAWWTQLEQAEREECFFAAAPGFIVCGRVPRHKQAALEDERT